MPQLRKAFKRKLGKLDQNELGNRSTYSVTSLLFGHEIIPLSFSNLDLNG
jgi:hypothetical protein